MTAAGEPRTLRGDAERIIAASLEAVQPGEAVRRALADFRPPEGRTVLVAAGLLVCTAYLVAGTYNPFLYSNF